MTTKAVVFIALLSALLGAGATGWVFSSRSAQARSQLERESTTLRVRAELLDSLRRSAQAQVDSQVQAIEVQTRRADSATAKARILSRETEALEREVAQAATLRDSVERFVTLVAGLKEDRDQWRRAEGEAQAGWAAEREARVRLGAVVAAADSGRAVDRARNAALAALLVKERAGKRGGFFGLSIPVKCGPGAAVTHKLEGRVIAGCVVAM